MPDIQARTADGVIHNFPDGTAPEVMDAAIKKYVTTTGALEQSKAPTQFEKDRTLEGSPASRFGSGVYAGAKAMIPPGPHKMDNFELATGGMGPLPGMLRGAFGAYQQARSEDQGIGSSLASAFGSAVGLDAPDIRSRALKGDYAGVIGEAIPSMAATLIGGESGKIAKGVGNVRDYVGNQVRTETGALKPTYRNSARVAGGYAGHMTGIPGAELGGFLLGQAVADTVLPKRPPLPGVAPSLPSAGEFYENRGNDLMVRGRSQDVLDRRSTSEQTRLERQVQAARDARDQAMTEHGQSIMRQNAYQDKLDALKVKADNALARSKRSSQMQQGSNMASEIEHNQELSRQATEAADMNRAMNERAAQEAQDKLQASHDDFANALKELENHRQQTLANRGKLNDQFGSALMKRGNTSLSKAISGDIVKGNTSPFGSSADFQPDDLITRNRRLTIPGEEPSPVDLKRAGDFTQAPVERLKQLAKFGDKLAQNELNRRLKN